ncbi:MAG: hypothetical protein NTX54_10995, partial [Chloroflexi bacterium]|nr:hypothetical protein [Chloroflexota bacterium]
MIRREPGTPGVPSPAGHPSTTVDLDGEHECGPCEIEPPSSTEVLGERVFRLNGCSGSGSGNPDARIRTRSRNSNGDGGRGVFVRTRGRGGSTAACVATMESRCGLLSTPGVGVGHPIGAIPAGSGAQRSPSRIMDGVVRAGGCPEVPWDADGVRWVTGREK